jgi:arabinose-5-phosphate isomerase
MGMTAIVDAKRKVVGVFTDGDLRRTLEHISDVRRIGVAKVMSVNPTTIRSDQLAVEALKLMEERKITQLPVVDARGRMIGALNMHDLFRAKAV